tara:strand:+ start:1210 stop:1377 length:168 start_codon:yes stop_codon:yes gene_type:complete
MNNELIPQMSQKHKIYIYLEEPLIFKEEGKLFQTKGNHLLIGDFFVMFLTLIRFK